MIFYIILSILMFGLLIAVHELGHFVTAKWLGVRVNEFAIGMGPVVWSKTKGETQYSLRALPIGGFCAMEGEESQSDDPRAFINKAAWKKFIILIAGSFMNFLTGFLIVLALFSGMKQVPHEMVAEFRDDSPLLNSQLQVGDQFLKVDGKTVSMYGDAHAYLGQAGDMVDLLVLRDGEKVALNGFDMTRYPVMIDGESYLLRGITIGAVAVDATPWTIVKLSVNQAVDYARMVWNSLGELVTGNVSVSEMSGVIGIVNSMGEVGEASAEAAVEAGSSAMMGALSGIMYFTAFIAVNLAVMNLLPIPALDGGRIFFLAINCGFTALTKRRLDPKYEGYVNILGLIALLGLMLVVAFNDVIRLIF